MKAGVATALRATPFVMAALFALAFLWVALSRVTYPFDLEWMEGAQLTSSRELLAGRAIYRSPSADFIAFGYQPLYAVVVAGISALSGLAPPTGRAVSIASTCVLAFLLARIASRETGSKAYGLLGAGLCFATYPITAFWFDLVRVDSLFLALLFGGLYVARYSSSRWAWLRALLLLFAAYKTKQLALPFFVLPVLFLASTSRSRAALYAITALALLVVDRVAGDILTHGWYSFYVVKIPTGQPYDWRRLTLSFWVRIFVQMPVVLIFAMLGIVRAVHRRPRLQVLRETWALAALLGIAATLAAWARPGGASNNLLTTYLFAIPPALRELRCWSRRARPSFRTAPLSLLAAQFAVLLYDPRAQIPTSAEVQQARAFIDRLSSIAGPVLVPEHPWYAILAGKEPSYHSCALWELQRTLGQDRWPDDLRARLAAGYYRAVFTAWSTDAPDLGSYPPELATRYRVTDRLTFQGRELDALSGKRGTRPSLAYAPATGAF